MKRMTEQQIDQLVAAAEAARENAYAPYSGFAVGAAVMVDDGQVFAGCNVENASYGLGVCAERHAVAAAVAAGCRTILGLAVVTAASPPAAPCGACRQVLAEFGDYPVVLANPEGVREITSVSRLLPSAFDRETLERARQEVRRGAS
jgi:cytidine deaminase